MIRPAIASLSLGVPEVHDISTRLHAAAIAGFQGVEIVDGDVETVAKTLPGGATDENREDAAKRIRQICEELGLTVIVFQSFRFYEGLLDRKQHEAMIQKLRLWCSIVKILGTDMIQLPANWMQEGTTDEEKVVVADLIEMAEIALAEEPVVRIAYEGIAWGKYADTWERSWELVKKVNRPNFGLCLDTFHIAGRTWGDPTTASGQTDDADRQLQKSLRQLVTEVDVSKVFYVQAGDAEKLDPPLDDRHPFFAADQPARMSWSRNARLFPYEQGLGGYLPIESVMVAIVNGLGYDGWVSMELFSKELWEVDPEIPARYAARAEASWEKMLLELK